VTGPDAWVVVTHLAISATGPEPGAVWGEHITDEEYAAAVQKIS